MSSLNEHKEEEECLDALLICHSLVLPMVIKAAMELDLFEIIAKAGSGAHISASEIASLLPTNNPDAPYILDRMLHLLATHSVLTYSLRKIDDGRGEKLYALTPASQLFVRSNDGLSFSDHLALVYHPVMLEVRMNLKDAILKETNGDLFKKIHGMSMYEYMSNDPTFRNIFSKAMAGKSQFIMKRILEVYKGYEGLTSLVDVGGGNGKCLHMITSKYPSIKAINFDLPHVTQEAPTYPGIQHVGGDMFSAVPTADAIMLKDVCHNWSDENCIRLLRNCHEALPSNGKLIIISAIMQEEPESSKYSIYASIVDNIMLTHTSSGKQRTAKELETLCREAGFSDFQIVSSFQGIIFVIESFKYGYHNG